MLLKLETEAPLNPKLPKTSIRHKSGSGECSPVAACPCGLVVLKSTGVRALRAHGQPERLRSINSQLRSKTWAFGMLHTESS